MIFILAVWIILYLRREWIGNYPRVIVYKIITRLLSFLPTNSISLFSEQTLTYLFSTTAWKVPVFGGFMVRIFPHLDWIRTRKTPNTEFAVYIMHISSRKIFKVTPMHISSRKIFKVTLGSHLTLFKIKQNEDGGFFKLPPSFLTWL